MKNIKNLSLRKKEKERKFPVKNPVFNGQLWKSLWKTPDEGRKTQKERKRMGYSQLVFCCPYYSGDAKRSVFCEGGHIELPDRKTAEEFFHTYCGDVNGWRRCTVARAISRFYEREEDE